MKAEKKGTNVNNETFSLSDHLKAVILDGDEDATFQDRSDVWSRENAASIKSFGSQGTLTEKDEERFIALAVYMPPETGNDANPISPEQAPKIELGVILNAIQAPFENDSFEDQYDDVHFSTSESIITDLQSNEPVYLSENVQMNEIAYLPANSKIDMGGNTMTGSKMEFGLGDNVLKCGTIEQKKAPNDDGSDAAVNSFGNLVLEDVTIEASASNKALSSFATDEDISSTITNSTLYGNVVLASSTKNNNYVELKDSTIEFNKTGHAIDIQGWTIDGQEDQAPVAQLVINGGTYSRNTTAMATCLISAQRGAQVIINDGTFHDSNALFYAKDLKQTINEVEYLFQSGTIIVNGGNFTVDRTSGLAKVDHVENLIINAGTFNVNPSKYVPSTSTVEKVGDLWVVTQNS